MISDLLFGLAALSLFLPGESCFVVDCDSGKAREAKEIIKSKTYLSGFGDAIKAADDLYYAADTFRKNYNNTIENLGHYIKNCKLKISYIKVDLSAHERERDYYLNTANTVERQEIKSYMDSANGAADPLKRKEAEDNARIKAKEYRDFANGEECKAAEYRKEIARIEQKIEVLERDLNDLYDNKGDVERYCSDVNDLKSKLRSAEDSAQRDADDICRKADNAIEEIEGYLSVRIEG